MTLRVLLIDDNPPDRIRYRRMLQQRGPDAFEIVEAEDGASGLAALDDRIDIVLLDQDLPDIQGLQVLEEIRRRLLPPPVIMLTGEEDAAVSIEAMQLGAADYLMKRRIDEDRLLRAINGAIDRSALQQRVEEQQRRLSRFYRLVNQTEDALFIAEATTARITESNEAARVRLGLPTHEGSTAQPAAFASAELWRAFCREAQRDGSARYEWRFQQADGSEAVMEILARAIEEDGTPYIVAVGRDVSMRKRYEQVLIERSLRDGLTGMWNRRAFDERLIEVSRTALRHQRPMAVALIDVDHFKAYNDSLGHPAGDDCLRRVARALRGGVLRSGSMLARYGGEEFVVLLEDADLEGGRLVGERLRQAVLDMALPHPESKTHSVVTVSVGIASMIPVEDADGVGLVAAADAALYGAKQSGRNRVAVTKSSA